MKKVWVYDAGNGRTIKFETADEAREWFDINNPEVVAFEQLARGPDDPNEAYEVVPIKQEPHVRPGAPSRDPRPEESAR